MVLKKSRAVSRKDAFFRELLGHGLRVLSIGISQKDLCASKAETVDAAEACWARGWFSIGSWLVKS
jgi:hypothetical protein